MPVEVKTYIRSDGVKVAGYVRNSKGEGGASFSKGKKRAASIAGNWRPNNLQFNPDFQGNVDFEGKNPVSGNLAVESDLGGANLRYSKTKGIEAAITPNVMGIAQAVGGFLKNQAQKAANAPGTVADAVTQTGQSAPTAANVIPPPPPVPAGVEQAFAPQNVAATVIGGGVLAASPVLFPGAATPAAMSAGATGTALLLPAAGATVARGGVVTPVAAKSAGTAIAGAMTPATMAAAAAALGVGVAGGLYLHNRHQSQQKRKQQEANLQKDWQEWQRKNPGKEPPW